MDFSSREFVRSCILNSLPLETTKMCKNFVSIFLSMLLSWHRRRETLETKGEWRQDSWIAPECFCWTLAAECLSLGHVGQEEWQIKPLVLRSRESNERYPPRTGDWEISPQEVELGREGEEACGKETCLLLVKGKGKQGVRSPKTRERLTLTWFRLSSLSIWGPVVPIPGFKVHPVSLPPKRQTAGKYKSLEQGVPPLLMFLRIPADNVSDQFTVKYHEANEEIHQHEE